MSTPDLLTGWSLRIPIDMIIMMGSVMLRTLSKDDPRYLCSRVSCCLGRARQLLWARGGGSRNRAHYGMVDCVLTYVLAGGRLRGTLSIQSCCACCGMGHSRP